MAAVIIHVSCNFQNNDYTTILFMSLQVAYKDNEEVITVTHKNGFK